jgi:TPR repeat protein
LELGKGVPQDLPKAVELYKQSAEQGNADGQSSFGRCLEHGICVTRDLRLAAEFYKRAAEQGNAYGQFCFVRLELGLGV